jgi:hypothetical protein
MPAGKSNSKDRDMAPGAYQKNRKPRLKDTKERNNASPAFKT